MTYYLKQSLSAYQDFVLNKLFKFNVDTTLDEFSIQHKTQVFYDLYTNDLCIHIFSQIEEFKLQLVLTLAFIECYKVLIDCFTDFGQYYATDNIYTTKLFSPYAKIFDQCQLSNEASLPPKSIEPFTSGSFLYEKNTIYWVGSNDYSSGYYPDCFPGNIIRSIYLWEKKYLSSVGAPQVLDS